MRRHQQELPATAGSVRRARRQQGSSYPRVPVQPVRWPGINQCVVLTQWQFTHTHTRLTAPCPWQPGWAGTRKVKPIWILLKQEIVSGNCISWAICKCAHCSRQITTPAPHHSVFYRPDALPAAKPTASKQWQLFAIIDCFLPSSIRGLATPWTCFLYLSLFDHSDWLFHGSSVHIFMLSIQAVRGLSHLRAPGIVPCIISFSRQLPCFLMVWP